jgi:hypothetical protein
MREITSDEVFAAVARALNEAIPLQEPDGRHGPVERRTAGVD